LWVKPDRILVAFSRKFQTSEFGGFRAGLAEIPAFRHASGN
jgi:hypothetical protein